MVHINQFDSVTLADLRSSRFAKWIDTPDGIPAHISETDFPVAPAVSEAIRSAASDGILGYISSALIHDLGAATSAWYRATTEWAPKPEWVFPVSDIFSAYRRVLEHFLPPEASVALPMPAYGPFLQVTQTTGRKVIPVDTVIKAGKYRIDLDSLSAAFQQGARLLVLCNPHNPLGSVLKAAEISEIAELVDRVGAKVFSDEIHQPLVRPGIRFVPYASFDHRTVSHTITVTSASKGWNIAGLKTAQILFSHQNDADRWRQLGFSGVSNGASTLGIAATIGAYRDSSGWINQLNQYLDLNEQLLAETVEHVAGLQFLPAAASFFAWLDFSQTTVADDPANILWERAQVKLLAGELFGDRFAGFARLNFGTSRQVLEEILTRISASVF